MSEKISRGNAYELDIESLAYGGRGVAHLHDGRVAFVERALPGDRCLVTLTKVKQAYAEGFVSELITPSPDRVPPLCLHHERCGGCSWQSLSYEKQIQAKESQFTEAFKHLGHISIEADPIIPASAHWRYRNKMEFTFGDGPEGDLRLGLHERRSHWKIVDLDGCHLPSERMSGARATVLEVAKSSGMPNWHNRRHEGFWRHVMVREGMNTGDLMVNIITTEGPLPKQELLAALAPLNPSTVVWSVSDQVSATRVDRRETLLGDGTIRERLRDIEYTLSAESFFQTNTAMAETLYSLVEEYAGLSGKERLLDLYCGIGAIGLFLAKKAKAVMGIESVEQAIEDAKMNARLNSIDNATFLAGQAEKVLPAIIESGEVFDVVVVDPPRAGLHPKALRALLDLRAPRVVYVSCNPTTLARDLVDLIGEGYKVVRARPVDMFPHTYHIEGVVLLEL